MAEVFNKSALKRLSSPEQLDKAIKITSPLSWLALMAMTFIVVIVIVWSFLGTIPVTVTGNGVVTNPSGVISIYAPESGMFIACAESGAAVEDGSYIFTYQDSEGIIKTLALSTTRTGVVDQQIISVTKNSSDNTSSESGHFDQGAELLHITPKVSSGKLVVCYLKTADANKVKSGMSARVMLTSKDKQKYGYMTANVIHVCTNATTDKGFKSAGCSELATEFKDNKAVVAVICELALDKTSENGYKWSNKKGASLSASELFEGTARAEIKIVTEEIAPINKFINDVKGKWGD